MEEEGRSIRLQPDGLINKTGLQPLSRPVELVHYFGGWVEGASKQTDRTDVGGRKVPI